MIELDSSPPKLTLNHTPTPTVVHCILYSITDSNSIYDLLFCLYLSVFKVKVNTCLGQVSSRNILLLCGIPQVTDWPLGPQGLLYDRMWVVVNENGVCLSQKREPKLCLIHPHICLTSKTLCLEASGQRNFVKLVSFYRQFLQF